MAHGVRHPDREADHRSRRSGRAAGTAATMIRVPPVSSIWIQSGDGHRPSGVSSGSDPGRRPCLGTPRRSRLPRPRPSGHRRMRMPGASISLFRHHAERRGRSGRTPAYPPICHRTVPSVRSAEGAQNGIFCRVLAICWRMRGEVQQPEPAAPSHEGMTTAVCVTASSANATMERLTTRGRWLGLSGHDYRRYAAILHLTVMIGIAFAQAHRTYGPAGRRTHVWGARIRVQTVLWHRSSRICPQVKDSQAWIARPFTKRLLTERR
jgi:hypothetical protein